MRFAPIIVLVFCLQALGFGADIYVPDDYSSIQAAINAAGTGDTVIVRSDAVHGGPWKENIDFVGKAITVQSDLGASATTIDGNSVGSVVTFDTGETATSVLDGFTITNGSATNGGGIYCNTTSPTLLNLIIDSNVATYGGGIYCIDGNLDLDGFTVTNNTAGSNGAGIYMNNGTLTVTDSTFSTNKANLYGGGIYHNTGSLDISLGQFDANEAWASSSSLGGAIYFYGGDLSVSESTLSQNFCRGSGGAIYYSTASLDITDCTIYQNTCPYASGGAIYGYTAMSYPTTVTGSNIYDNEASAGAGLYLRSLGDVLLVNNLIHGNEASSHGGGFYLRGNASSTFLNNTISSNSSDTQGGGMYCYGTESPVITNTILWDNTAPTGPELRIDTGTPVITYSDVEGSWSDSEGDWVEPWYGTGCIDQNPYFFNAFNDDYHIVSISPCKDTGDNSVLATLSDDIDGDLRPYPYPGGTVDMGADEWTASHGAGAPGTYTVPGDYGTIQAAIDGAYPTDVINVAANTYSERLDFKGRAVTIQSVSGAASTILDGSLLSGSVVTFASGEGADSVLDGFTITNGSAANGGGIYCVNDSSPTLLDLVIDNNTATTSGGGIYCKDGNLDLDGFTVTNNTAGSTGGGIYMNNGTLTVTDSTFSTNKANLHGGGIYHNKGSLDISLGQFDANEAWASSSSLGGAIYFITGDLSLSESTLSQSYCRGSGGAIYYSAASLDVTKCSLYENSSPYANGGAIHGYNARTYPTTVTGSYIYDNEASTGSGLFLRALGDVLLVNNLIHGNEASYNAGGIYLRYSVSSTLINNTISNNSAGTNGGGIFCYGTESPVITNTILWDNTAPTGPELRIDTGTPVITYSDVEGSWSDSEGDWVEPWYGTGCIDQNPYFFNSFNDDYHIVSISPCKDTGDNSVLAMLSEDIEGDQRPYPYPGGTIDMGADEWTITHGAGAPGTYTVPGTYATIQAAIDAAYPTDVINVTATPGDPTNIDFKGRAVTVQNDTDATIVLDGGGAGSVVTFASGEGADSVLDGFTITNGNAANGGGIYCVNDSSPTLLKLVIDLNTATTSGGGIYCKDGDLDLDGFTVTNNTAGSTGGGIYMNNGTLTVTDSTFSTNKANLHGGGIYHNKGSLEISLGQFDANEAWASSSSLGGAIYFITGDLSVSENTLSQNYSRGSGGAIYYSMASLDLTKCSLYENSSPYANGGAIHGYNATSYPTTVTGSYIHDNEASAGGGLYLRSLGDVLLVNNLIHGNEASSHGGGIYLRASASSTLINNTISSNSSDTQGGGIYCYGAESPVITNTILWDNTAPTGPELRIDTGTPVITYSDVEGSWSDSEGDWVEPWYGTGCIDQNPYFFNSFNDDYHIVSISPCKDTGDNSVLATLSDDIEGDLRPYPYPGGTVDMGADEWTISHGAGGPGTYTVPGDYGTIQAAIDGAYPTDVINVAANTYSEKLDFKGRAVTIQSVSGAASTILDGSLLSGSVVTFASGEGADSVLGGFTITNGNAANGGGIYCINDSSPTLLDLVIDNNTATTSGGGIYCKDGALSLDGFTVTNNTAGSTGGGIYMNNGTLTVTDSTISTNKTNLHGGGIYHNKGSLDISLGQFDANEAWASSSSLGGAIYLITGDMSLSESTFSQNYCRGSGGAIYYSAASLDLTKCSLYENSSPFGSGGAIDAYNAPSYSTTVTGSYIYDNEASTGGGLYLRSLGDVLVVNNLIQGNTASSNGGGLYLRGNSSSTFLNNTISSNSAESQGGGFYCYGAESPVITNTILWDNAAPTGPELRIETGTPVVTYSDVEGSWSDSEGDWVEPWYGTGCIDQNPYFFNAFNNDFHIVSISPCKDTGDNSVLAMLSEDIEGDQRPYPYPGGTIDMGADEWTITHGAGAPGTYTVPGTYATIQAAIDAAYPTDVINVTATPGDPANIDFKGRAVTVQNDTDAAIVLDGGGSGSVVTFASGEGADSVLDGFTITNGSAENGGGIYCDNNSSPTLLKLVIDLNTATTSGGGIYCKDGNLSLDGFTVTNNTAGPTGGGIYMNNGTLTVTDSTFSTNKANLYGGGIYHNTGSLGISLGQFDANEAWASSSSKGGAICFITGDLSVSESTLSQNYSRGSGGAIYYSAASLDLTKCSLYENSSPYVNGGAIYGYSAASSPTTVTSCYIYDNEAATGGGLVLQSLGDVLLVNNLFYGNTATANGGGLYLRGNASSTLTNNTLTQNAAGTTHSGGGIYCYAAESPVITNTILWGNTALTDPELRFGTGTPTITYCNIEGGTGQSWYGTGCIDSDPLFADSGNGDFHLTTPSPCVDVGDDSDPNLPDKDLEDQPRRWDGDNDGSIVVDMGADEHNNPDLVELVTFTATGFGNTIMVGWETASEIDTAGFHIWRSDRRNPEGRNFVRITGQLIPAKGTPSQGATYSFIDTPVVNGCPYRYRLEDVDLSGGSTFHDPVIVRWWMPGLKHH